jgi:hypothetical protein
MTSQAGQPKPTYTDRSRIRRQPDVGG